MQRKRLTYLLASSLLFWHYCGNAQTAQTVPFGQKEIPAKVSFTRKLQNLKQSFLNPGIQHPTRYLGIEATAHTNGWSAGLFLLKTKNLKKPRIYSLTVQEIKHPKEEKLQSRMYEIRGEGKPLPYTFGKINQLYLLNVGAGQLSTLVPALVRPGIDLSLLLQGGFSLACLKPYYLKLNVADTGGYYKIDSQPYNTQTEEKYLNPNRIYGRAAWKEGLDNTRVIPGMHLTAAAHIQLSPKQVWFKAIAVGTSLQAFTAPLPLLADTKARWLHAGLFMRVQVGKGW